jgi:hypothetical protein
MNLKTQAKTTLDILNENCQGEQKLKGGNKIDEQWIRLDIAQRELDRAKTAYRVKYDQRNELYSKITEANKKVSELLKPLPKGLKDSTVIMPIKDLEELRYILSDKVHAPTFVNKLSEGKV